MDTRKSDLNLLLAFEALLAERNVTKAAKRLNLSQPALSAQLARLRSLFADELFVPTSRGVLPTARALELEDPLRETLERARVLIGSRDVFNPEESRLSFALGGSDYVQIAVLLPFLLLLHAEAPNLRARLCLNDSRTAGTDMAKGELDLSFLQPKRVEGNLRSQVLFQENYVGIARKGSLQNGAIDMERFLAASHVIVSPRSEGYRGPTDTALATLGFERDVCFAVSSFVVLIDAVATSDLLAMAPRRLALANLNRVDVFDPPLAVPGFSIAMVWHDRTHHHSGHRWLRQRLSDFCKTFP